MFGLEREHIMRQPAIIALFGFPSSAALATVVMTLVEVPVMLSVVHIVRRSRVWDERA
jgi:ACR3 family arsenite transporter